MFLDGTQVGSTVTNSQTITAFNDLVIGNLSALSFQFNGYISNVRLVKGTAVYTSNFTPSTSPLTAITNTTFLGCQSNQFKDSSTTNQSVTITGTPKVTPFSPFKDDDARDITTDGGSVYFDGGDHHLSAGSYPLGSGNWTVEFWLYLTGNPLTNFSTLIDWRTAGSAPTGVPVLNINTSRQLIWYQQVTGGPHLTTTSAVPLNQWSHIVLEKRNSNTMAIIVDGVIFGQISDSATYNSQVFNLGNVQTSYGFPGYVSDLRIVTGTAVYNASVTRPTSPLTAITNTSLLLNFQDSAIPDLSGLNNIDTVGNAKVGASDPTKYGSNAMEFDGTGDYLIAGENPDLAPGAGDFTVEFWMYGVTNNFYNALYQNYTDGVSRTTALRINTNVTDQTSLMVQTAATGLITTASGVVTANAWNHVALVRNGSSLVLYVNGVSAGSTTNTTDFSDGYAVIGNAAYNGTNYFFNGYIDDFRITKGVARYTANFTAPDAALPKF